MTQEDLDSLGFGPDRTVKQTGNSGQAKSPNDDQEKVIAGLEGAKKKKGSLFGIRW